MTYKQVYQILLQFAKLTKWQVVEREIKDRSVDGYIDVVPRRIIIDTKQSVKRRCVTLSHELIGHGMQWDSNKKKFRRFFNAFRLPNTKENRHYISYVEINASKRAAKFLKAIGIKRAEKLFEELNKGDDIKWLKIFWEDRYLQDR